MSYENRGGRSGEYRFQYANRQPMLATKAPETSERQFWLCRLLGSFRFLVVISLGILAVNTILLAALYQRTEVLNNTLLEAQGIMTAFIKTGAIETVGQLVLRVTTDYLPVADRAVMISGEVVDALIANNGTQTIQDLLAAVTAFSRRIDLVMGVN